MEQEVESTEAVNLDQLEQEQGGGNGEPEGGFEKFAKAELAKEGTEQEKAPAEAAKTEQQAAFDAAKFKQELFAEFKQLLNPVHSQLGQLNKFRSEAAKQTQAPQVPKSWAELDPATQQTTKEMLQHVFNELYGDKFSAVDELKQAFEAQQQQEQIRQQVISSENVAREYLGADFQKYDAEMGKLFIELGQKADSGDEKAARFVYEIQHTASGVERLADLAKARIAETIEAKNAQAVQAQQAKAKRASTAVNTSTAPVAPQWSADNLPKDRAERMKVVKEMLDQAAQD